MRRPASSGGAIQTSSGFMAAWFSYWVAAASMTSSRVAGSMWMKVKGGFAISEMIAIEHDEMERSGIEGIMAVRDVPGFEEIVLVLEITIMISDHMILAAGEAFPLGEETAAGIEPAFRAAEIAALDDEIRLAGDGGIDEGPEADLLVLAVGAVVDIGDESERERGRSFLRSGGGVGLAGGFRCGEGGKGDE